MALALQRHGAGGHSEVDAAAAHARRQQRAGAGIELALHRPIHRMHHRDHHAAGGEAGGGLQAQQPAANHHRPAPALRRAQHGADIGEITIADHAGQVGAGQRQADGLRAGGEDEVVIIQRLTRRGDGALGRAVDGDDGGGGAIGHTGLA